MRIANLQGKKKAGETSPSLKSILRKLDEDEDLESITQMDFQESIGRGKIAMTVEREKKGKIPALANLAGYAFDILERNGNLNPTYRVSIDQHFWS